MARVWGSVPVVQRRPWVIDSLRISSWGEGDIPACADSGRQRLSVVGSALERRSSPSTEAR